MKYATISNCLRFFGHWYTNQNSVKYRLLSKERLRRTCNPPEVRVTSGQKPSTKTIYNVLQTSAGLF